MQRSLKYSSSTISVINGPRQIDDLSQHLPFLAGSSIEARDMDRVFSALNFLTGEGVNYYPNNTDSNEVEALIADYFIDGPSDDDDSDDELSHKNAGWF